MSITKNKMNWECMANHCPDWLENLDNAITACMSKGDLERCNVILERYNILSEKEESNNEDGYSLYGVEDEKQDLVNEFIAIHEKYKSEAESLGL